MFHRSMFERHRWDGRHLDGPEVLQAERCSDSGHHKHCWKQHLQRVPLWSSCKCWSWDWSCKHQSRQYKIYNSLKTSFNDLHRYIAYDFYIDKNWDLEFSCKGFVELNGYAGTWNYFGWKYYLITIFNNFNNVVQTLNCYSAQQ